MWRAQPQDAGSPASALARYQPSRKCGNKSRKRKRAVDVR
jgi:hypothetical protein